MSRSQTSTRARVLRPSWRWPEFSLRTPLQDRNDRALAVQIERLERLGDWERATGARSRAMIARQRWL
jgi:hypothetical protein